MKIRFVYDIRSQANYLCFLAKDIYLDRFLGNGFVVLPEIIKGNQYSVYFPDMNWTAGFWKEIAKCKQTDFDQIFPPKAVSEAIKMIGKQSIVQDKTIERVINGWEKIEAETNSSLTEFFGRKYMSSIGDIKVLITKYGTSGSFSFRNSRKKNEIYISYRIDMPVESIARTIALAVYAKQKLRRIELGEKGWDVRKGVAELFTERLSFYRKNKFSETVKPEYFKRSKLYMHKLGLRNFENNRELKVEEKIWTEQEQRLIGLLVGKKGNIATYDEIGEVLWSYDCDAKFSLYAISKVVENIRRKITKLGMNQEVVRTAKGKGYFIN